MRYSEMKALERRRPRPHEIEHAGRYRPRPWSPARRAWTVIALIVAALAFVAV